MADNEQVTIPGVDVTRERMTYPKLKSVDDIPVSRSQLTHDWMLDYTVAKGTPEQAQTLLDFIENNQVIRGSHLPTCHGVEYTVTDIKPMRDLFCTMFFPGLKEAKGKSKSKESQLDKARRMLGKAAQATPKRTTAASKSKK